ncbi:hypothetical protein Tco_1343310 [Tanacetum coccineum]
MTHLHPKRSFVPQAVLTKSGKLSTAGAAVNTVRPVNTANTKAVNTAASKPIMNHPKTKTNAFKRGYSIKEYKEKGVIDSGCSRHMTGNKCYLDEYEDYDGGFVSFGDGNGRISRKVVVGNQTNGIAGTKDNIVAGQAQKEKEPKQEYILIPFCTTDPLISQGPKDSEEDAGMKPTEVNESGAFDKGEEDDQDTRSEFESPLQKEKQTEHPNSTNSINTVSTSVSTAGPSLDNTAGTIDSTANAFEEHLFA